MLTGSGLERRLFTRLLYRRLCDYVIVTGGELTRRALIERDRFDPHRVDAFSIGIDVTCFRPGMPTRDLRQELGIPGDHLLVGIVSYLRAYKGHRYFLEAASEVLSRIKKVTFVIVGEGPEEHNLRTQIAELGLTDRVLLLGFREDQVEALRSLNVFVLPPVEGDTIPQALMQALAVGLPVISTAIGSIPDIVKDGHTGLLVPPRDSICLAERILTLLQDESLDDDSARLVTSLSKSITPSNRCSFGLKQCANEFSSQSEGVERRGVGCVGNVTADSG